MSIAFLALIIAIAAAGWLLFRIAGSEKEEPDKRAMTGLKIIVWLALSAALLAAKLWPLAFMVLIAAGGVMGIEAWRDGKARELDEAPPPSPPGKTMTEDEARSILGLRIGDGPDDIRTAHRKLISQLHPDKGGTDYLAAKINEARDFLLRKFE